MPSGEAVNAGEEVGEALRWRKGSNEIQIDVAKVGIWCCRCEKWGHSMLLDVRPLALTVGKIGPIVAYLH